VPSFLEIGIGFASADWKVVVFILSRVGCIMRQVTSRLI
jgi:hypothetical protein